MNLNLNIDQKSTILHSTVGIGIGLLSGIMSKDPYQIGNGGIVIFMLGILALLYYVSQKFFSLKANETAEKKYGKKWYLSNGAYPYMIFWLVAWIFLYNL